MPEQFGLACLRHHEFFAGRSRDFLDRILAAFKVEKFPAQAILMRHGDPANTLYYLHVGELEVLGADMKRVASLPAGSVVGEMALFVGQKRTATIRATQWCECRSIDRQVFADILQDFPTDRSYFEQVAENRGAILHKLHESRIQQELESLAGKTGLSALRGKTWSSQAGFTKKKGVSFMAARRESKRGSAVTGKEMVQQLLGRRPSMVRQDNMQHQRHTLLNPRDGHEAQEEYLRSHDTILESHHEHHEVVEIDDPEGEAWSTLDTRGSVLPPAGAANLMVAPRIDTSESTRPSRPGTPPVRREDAVQLVDSFIKAAFRKASRSTTRHHSSDRFGSSGPSGGSAAGASGQLSRPGQLRQPELSQTGVLTPRSGMDTSTDDLWCTSGTLSGGASLRSERAQWRDMRRLCRMKLELRPGWQGPTSKAWLPCVNLRDPSPRACPWENSLCNGVAAPNAAHRRPRRLPQLGSSREIPFQALELAVDQWELSADSRHL